MRTKRLFVVTKAFADARESIIPRELDNDWDLGGRKTDVRGGNDTSRANRKKVERVRVLDWGFDCGIGLADPRIYFVAPGW